MNMSDVNYSIENSLRPNGNEVIMGVDEVGRGPWAGPVTACAVILDPDNIPVGLNDSKKLTPKRRFVLFEEIMTSSILSYVHVDVDEIDEINILQATMRTMHRSIKDVIKQSNKENYLLLIDGNYFRPVTYVSEECEINHINYETIKGGDNLYCSIAAASILAKVDRDKYIDELCENNPYLIENYSINTNKGYAAKKHRDGIEQHGISPYHRKTYGICKRFS